MIKFILFYLILLGQLAFAQNEIKASISAHAYKTIFSQVEKAFEQKTGIKIKYINDINRVSGSVSHFKDVVDGKAEFSVAAIEFAEWTKLVEKESPKTSTKGISYRVIGKDLLVLVTNSAISKKVFDDKQLELIFSNQAKNWSEFGDANFPIQIVINQVSKSRNSMFQKRVGQTINLDHASVIKVKTDEELFDQLKKHKGAVAFLPETGFDLSGLTVHSGPEIGRPFTMLTKGRLSKNTLAFIEFMEKEGREILNKK